MTWRINFTWILVFASILVLCPTLWGQQGTPPTTTTSPMGKPFPFGGPQGGGQGPHAKQERLQALITLRLIEGLGLTQEQALKVAESMKRHQMKRRELRQKMEGLKQQLQMVANSNDPHQAAQVVTQLQKTREEIEGLDDAQFKEIKPLLTPQQQAKYLLLMEEIRREIQQFRRPFGGGQGMGGGSPLYSTPPGGGGKR